jgi:hypothetical protein
MPDQLFQKPLVGFVLIGLEKIRGVDQNIIKRSAVNDHMHIQALKGKAGVPDLTRLDADDPVWLDGGGVGIDIGGAAALNRKLKLKHGGFSVFADGNILSGDPGIVYAGGNELR